MTIRSFRRAVPAAVPGIVFLSGGQNDADATSHLNAMNATAEPHPWPLSFSYGRALQTAAQQAWKGDRGRIAAGQRAFHHRARLNGLARSGRYRPEMEPLVA
jgi:fructose-bisphosphate aldolase class I